MSAAMTLTLTKEQQDEAVERAEQKKAVAKWARASTITANEAFFFASERSSRNKGWGGASCAEAHATAQLPLSSPRNPPPDACRAKIVRPSLLVTEMAPRASAKVEASRNTARLLHSPSALIKSDGLTRAAAAAGNLPGSSTSEILGSRGTWPAHKQVQQNRFHWDDQSIPYSRDGFSRAGIYCYCMRARHVR